MLARAPKILWQDGEDFLDLVNSPRKPPVSGNELVY